MAESVWRRAERRARYDRSGQAYGRALITTLNGSSDAPQTLVTPPLVPTSRRPVSPALRHVSGALMDSEPGTHTVRPPR